jgi:energy-coupling factor transport system substrate-specific component
MEALPNIHLLGVLTMVYTIVFRKKALIPIYLYVVMNGVFAGFALWWLPYLYIWTVLWAITMLIPRNIPKKIACIVYPIICFLHGIAFGILYAPGQALMYGFGFKQTVAWIIYGLPYDVIHGLGNIGLGMLVLPLSELMKKLLKMQNNAK